MSGIEDLLPDDDFSEEEKELLSEKFVRGSEVDPIPRIPDVPDISEGPQPRKLAGLAQLRPNELPDPSRHYVIWGSKVLGDITDRAVKKTTNRTEDEYAKQAVEDVKTLLAQGLKNPGFRGKDRIARAEDYARWRYKGFVCGEVASL